MVLLLFPFKFSKKKISNGIAFELHVFGDRNFLLDLGLISHRWTSERSTVLISVFPVSLRSLIGLMMRQRILLDWTGSFVSLCNYKVNI